MVDRLGWIGASRRAATVEWLHGQVMAWWTDWSTIDALPEVGESASRREFAFWVRCGTAVAIASEGAGSLAGALVGVDGDDAGALARYVGEEALNDLARRVAGETEGVEHSSDAGELSMSLTDPRLGALTIAARIGGFEASIYLARAVIDRVARPATYDPVALSSRRAAVGEAAVRLRATLDLGEIALSELRELRPGDVIATHARLDTAPSLGIVGGSDPRVALGRLGERDGCRALQLITS